MRRESYWRTRNNPLHIDLCERSSQSLSSSLSSSTLDMALNDEGNVWRHLSDYARTVLQRPITCINAPLGRNANFRIDSHVMSMLPIFHGKPSPSVISDGRWTPPQAFHEQPLKMEETPFFSQMTARVCGGIPSSLIEPKMG